MSWLKEKLFGSRSQRASSRNTDDSESSSDALDGYYQRQLKSYIANNQPLSCRLVGYEEVDSEVV